MPFHSVLHLLHRPLSSVLVVALVLPLFQYAHMFGQIPKAKADPIDASSHMAKPKSDTENSVIYVFIDSQAKAALENNLYLDNEYKQFVNSLSNANKTYQGIKSFFDREENLGQFSYLTSKQRFYLQRVLEEADREVYEAEMNTALSNDIKNEIRDNYVQNNINPSDVPNVDRQNMGGFDSTAMNTNPLEFYLNQVREAYVNTDTKIVEINNDNVPETASGRNVQTYQIANILAEAYRNKKLIGAIMIGDIPIPKVRDHTITDEGQTVYPYNDMEDPYYVFSEDRKRWEISEMNRIKKAEIWNGLMAHKDPNDLRQYFKKLVYYYEYGKESYEGKYGAQDVSSIVPGVEKPAQWVNGDFGFFDVARFENALNADEFENYKFYVDHQDDILYHRMNQPFLKDATMDDQNQLRDAFNFKDRIASDPDLAGMIDEAKAGIGNDSASEEEDDVQTSILDNLDKIGETDTDIRAYDTAKKYLTTFSDLVSEGFLGDALDSIVSLGRWSREDIYSFVETVEYIDETTARELQEMNYFFEKQTNTTLFDLGNADISAYITSGMRYDHQALWDTEQYFNGYPLSYIANTGGVLACNNIRGIQNVPGEQEAVVPSISGTDSEVIKVQWGHGKEYATQVNKTRMLSALSGKDESYEVELYGSCSLGGLPNDEDLIKNMSLDVANPEVIAQTCDPWTTVNAYTGSDIYESGNTLPAHRGRTHNPWTPTPPAVPAYRGIDTQTQSFDGFVYDESGLVPNENAFGPVPNSIIKQPLGGYYHSWAIYPLDGGRAVSAYSSGSSYEAMSYMSCPVFQVGVYEGYINTSNRNISEMYAYPMDTRRYHISPFYETIEYQLQVMNNQAAGNNMARMKNITSFPADDPRGVSFLNNAGQFSFIKYIDFFEVLNSGNQKLREDIKEYQTWLSEQDTQTLARIAVESGLANYEHPFSEGDPASFSRMSMDIYCSGEMMYTPSMPEFKTAMLMRLVKKIKWLYGGLYDPSKTPSNDEVLTELEPHEIIYFANTFDQFYMQNADLVKELFRAWGVYKQSFREFKIANQGTDGFSDLSDIDAFAIYVRERLQEHVEQWMSKMEFANEEAYENMVAVLFRKEERIWAYSNFLRKLHHGDNDHRSESIDWIDWTTMLNGKQVDKSTIRGTAYDLYEQWMEHKNLEEVLNYFAQRDIFTWLEQVYELSSQMSAKEGEVFARVFGIHRPLEILRILALADTSEFNRLMGVSMNISDYMSFINIMDEGRIPYEDFDEFWDYGNSEQNGTPQGFLEHAMNNIFERRAFYRDEFMNRKDARCSLPTQWGIFFGEYPDFGNNTRNDNYDYSGINNQGKQTCDPQHTVDIMYNEAWQAYANNWETMMSEVDQKLSYIWNYEEELEDKSFDYHISVTISESEWQEVLDALETASGARAARDAAIADLEDARDDLEDARDACDDDEDACGALDAASAALDAASADLEDARADLEEKREAYEQAKGQYASVLQWYIDRISRNYDESTPSVLDSCAPDECRDAYNFLQERYEKRQAVLEDRAAARQAVDEVDSMAVQWSGDFINGPEDEKGTMPYYEAAKAFHRDVDIIQSLVDEMYQYMSSDSMLLEDLNAWQHLHFSYQMDISHVQRPVFNELLNPSTWSFVTYDIPQDHETFGSELCADCGTYKEELDAIDTYHDENKEPEHEFLIQLKEDIGPAQMVNDREVHRMRLISYLFNDLISQETAGQDNMFDKVLYSQYPVSQNFSRPANISDEITHLVEAGGGFYAPHDPDNQAVRKSPSYGKNNIHKTLLVVNELRKASTESVSIPLYNETLSLSDSNDQKSIFVPFVNPGNTRLQYLQNGVFQDYILDKSSLNNINTFYKLWRLRDNASSFLIGAARGSLSEWNKKDLYEAIRNSEDFLEFLLSEMHKLMSKSEHAEGKWSALLPLVYSLTNGVLEDINREFANAKNIVFEMNAGRQQVCDVGSTMMSHDLGRELGEGPLPSYEGQEMQYPLYDLRQESVVQNCHDVHWAGQPTSDVCGEDEIDFFGFKNQEDCFPGTVFQRFVLDVLMNRHAWTADETSSIIYPKYAKKEPLYYYGGPEDLIGHIYSDATYTQYPNGRTVLNGTGSLLYKQENGNQKLWLPKHYYASVNVDRDMSEYHKNPNLTADISEIYQDTQTGVISNGDVVASVKNGQYIDYEALKNRRNMTALVPEIFGGSEDSEVFSGSEASFFRPQKGFFNQQTGAVKDIGDIDFHLQHKYNRIPLAKDFEKVKEEPLVFQLGYMRSTGSFLAYEKDLFEKVVWGIWNLQGLGQYFLSSILDVGSYTEWWPGSQSIASDSDIKILSDFALRDNHVSPVRSFLNHYLDTFVDQYKQKLYFIYRWRNASVVQKVTDALQYALTGNYDRNFDGGINQLLDGLLYFMREDDNGDISLVEHAVARSIYTLLPAIPFYDVAYINIVGGDQGMSVDIKGASEPSAMQKHASNTRKTQAYFDDMSQAGSELSVATGANNIDDPEVYGTQAQKDLMEFVRNNSQISDPQTSDPQTSGTQTSGAQMPDTPLRASLDDRRQYMSSYSGAMSNDLQDLVDEGTVISPDGAQEIQSILTILRGGNYGESFSLLDPHNIAQRVLFGPQSKSLAAVAKMNLDPPGPGTLYLPEDNSAPFLVSFAAGAPIGESLRSHGEKNLVVWWDPALHLDEPRVPVRVAWDQSRIQADFEESRTYSGTFIKHFPNPKEIDWNDNAKIETFFKDISNNHSKSYEDLVTMYTIYSRTLTDRTIGREILRYDSDTKDLHHGAFLQDDPNDIILQTHDDHFLLYQKTKNDHSMYRFVGVPFLSPYKQEIYDIAVGDFVQTWSFAGYQGDDLILVTNQWVFSVVNEVDANDNHRFTLDQEWEGVFEYASLQEKIIAIETIENPGGPDAIAYVRANGEAGLVTLDDPDNPHMLLPAHGGGIGLDNFVTFDSINPDNKDDPGAQAYRKNDRRIPETHIYMEWFTEWKELITDALDRTQNFPTRSSTVTGTSSTVTGTSSTVTGTSSTVTGTSSTMTGVLAEEQGMFRTFDFIQQDPQENITLAWVEDMCPGYFGVCDQTVSDCASNPQSVDYTEEARECAIDLEQDWPALVAQSQYVQDAFGNTNNTDDGSDALDIENVARCDPENGWQENFEEEASSDAWSEDDKFFDTATLPYEEIEFYHKYSYFDEQKASSFYGDYTNMWHNPEVITGSSGAQKQLSMDISFNHDQIGEDEGRYFSDYLQDYVQHSPEVPKPNDIMSDMLDNELDKINAPWYEAANNVLEWMRADCAIQNKYIFGQDDTYVPTCQDLITQEYNSGHSIALESESGMNASYGSYYGFTPIGRFMHPYEFVNIQDIASESLYSQDDFYPFAEDLYRHMQNTLDEKHNNAQTDWSNDCQNDMDVCSAYQPPCIYSGSIWGCTGEIELETPGFDAQETENALEDYQTDSAYFENMTDVNDQISQGTNQGPVPPHVDQNIRRGELIDVDWNCISHDDEADCTVSLSKWKSFDMVDMGEHERIEIVFRNDKRFQIKTDTYNFANVSSDVQYITSTDDLPYTFESGNEDAQKFVFMNGEELGEVYDFRIILSPAMLSNNPEVNFTVGYGEIQQPKLKVFDVDSSFGNDTSGNAQKPDGKQDIYVELSDTQKYFFINQGGWSYNRFEYNAFQEQIIEMTPKSSSGPPIGMNTLKWLRWIHDFWNNLFDTFLAFFRVPQTMASGMETPPSWLDTRYQSNDFDSVVNDMYQDAKSQGDEYSYYEAFEEMGDGIATATEKFSAKINAFADIISTIGALFTCNNGCIATPINMVVQTGVDLETYVTPISPPFLSGGLAWFLCWIWLGAACVWLGPIYGVEKNVGIAATWGMCSGYTNYGPWGKNEAAGTGIPGVAFTYGGFVFAFNPIPDGFCNSVNAKVQSILFEATSFLRWWRIDATGKQNMISISANTNADGEISNDSINGGVTPNYNLDSYYSQRYQDMRDTWEYLQDYQLSGFPANLTKWLDRQIARFKKSLKPPVVKLRYPVPGTIPNYSEPLNEEASVGFVDVMMYIANLPMVNIEEQEVRVQVPSMSLEELALLKQEWVSWYNDLNAQFREKWCLDIPKVQKGDPLYEQGYRFDVSSYDGSFVANTRCGPITAQLDLDIALNAKEFAASVQRNIAIIEEYLQFPQRLYQYKYLQQLYMKEVTDTLRKVVELTGGWLVANMKIVQDWLVFAQMIKMIIEDWEILIEGIFNVVYGCSECQSYRYNFSLSHILITLLGAVIPSPPEIIFPKIPDITVDVSDMRFSLDILLPRLEIEPVKFEYPTLPNIQLPTVDVDADFSYTLPTIPDLPKPPELPEPPRIDLMPDIELPYLPPAPELPPAPGIIADVVGLLGDLLTLVCFIIKNNIVFPNTHTGQGNESPIPAPINLMPNYGIGVAANFQPNPWPPLNHWVAQCEVLTERPMTPILPIDFAFNLGFDTQTIDLSVVDEIKTYASLDARGRIDLTYFMQKIADSINGMTARFTQTAQRSLDSINQSMHSTVDNTNQDMEEAADNASVDVESDWEIGPNTRLYDLFMQNMNRKNYTAGPQISPFVIKLAEGIAGRKVSSKELNAAYAQVMGQKRHSKSASQMQDIAAQLKSSQKELSVYKTSLEDMQENAKAKVQEVVKLPNRYDKMIARLEDFALQRKMEAIALKENPNATYAAITNNGYKDPSLKDYWKETRKYLPDFVKTATDFTKTKPAIGAGSAGGFSQNIPSTGQGNTAGMRGFYVRVDINDIGLVLEPLTNFVAYSARSFLSHFDVNQDGDGDDLISFGNRLHYKPSLKNELEFTSLGGSLISDPSENDVLWKNVDPDATRNIASPVDMYGDTMTNAARFGSHMWTESFEDVHDNLNDVTMSFYVRDVETSHIGIDITKAPKLENPGDFYRIAGYNALWASDKRYQKLFVHWDSDGNDSRTDDAGRNIFIHEPKTFRVSQVPWGSEIHGWRTRKHINDTMSEYTYVTSEDMISARDGEVYIGFKEPQTRLHLQEGESYEFSSDRYIQSIQGKATIRYYGMDFKNRDLNGNDVLDMYEFFGTTDTDGDKIPDDYETNMRFPLIDACDMGPSAFNYDTDVSQIQAERHLDALLDLDNDGLTMREEFFAGTNPYKKDSDGDGIDDNREISMNYDPTHCNNFDLHDDMKVSFGESILLPENSQIRVQKGEYFDIMLSSDTQPMYIEFWKNLGESSFRFVPMQSLKNVYYRLESPYAIGDFYRFDVPDPEDYDYDFENPMARMTVSDDTVHGSNVQIMALNSEDNIGVEKYMWHVASFTGGQAIESAVYEDATSDIDMDFDADGDGNPSNDMDDPFLIFPFELHTNYKIKLQVKDFSGNVSRPIERVMYAEEYKPNLDFKYIDANHIGFEWPAGLTFELRNISENTTIGTYTIESESVSIPKPEPGTKVGAYIPWQANRKPEPISRTILIE